MRLIPLMLGAALGPWLLSCPDRSARLPELPQLEMTKFHPVVRARVEPAYSAARTNPRDAEAVGKLGMLLDAHRQDQGALACYRRAHALAPGSFRWAYLLGRSRAAAGQTAEGIVALREALTIDPAYAPARLALAEALAAENRFDEAVRAYETVLERDPNQAAAHYGLGRLYAQQGDEARSRDHFQKACELFPDYGAAHYALALRLRRAGDTAGSDRHLRAYEANKTALPPQHDPLRREVSELNAGAMPHLRRAAELEQAGKLEEAVAEHEQALQIDPELVQAHVNLISLYGKLGRLTQAEAHYRSAVQLDPKQADAYYNYGVLLFDRQQNAEAERAFQETLRINPYHAQAHHNRGFLFEQRGDLTGALAEYELAAKNQADYPLAHFHAGRILAARKQYDAAIVHLLRSLTPEDERTPAYLYALAATYARAGNRGEAIRFARRARSGAAARGQTALLASIDKDLVVLGRR